MAPSGPHSNAHNGPQWPTMAHVCMVCVGCVWCVWCVWWQERRILQEQQEKVLRCQRHVQDAQEALRQHWRGKPWPRVPHGVPVGQLEPAQSGTNCTKCDADATGDEWETIEDE